MAKLSDLKTLYHAAQERSPRPTRASVPQPSPTAKRAIAAAKHADGDIDLTKAFADVKKLPASNRAAIARAKPAPVPHHTLADERDVLEASKYGDDPHPQTWDTGQEFDHEQTFVRAGLGADVPSKLRRGQWSVQAELDLHGLTTDEAHDALSDFIVDSRTRRFRCVRVIHGKGLTSPNKEPVLKGKVRRWLAHWDEVLAYTEAPRHAGGSGALLVLLKGS
jgi:DNA-nicking Smr family endonuclease